MLNMVHCKKILTIFRPQPECHKPNSSWPGIITVFPASLVSDIPAEDGKIANLFLTVYTKNLAKSAGKKE
jgi:hypothetical protein